MDKLLKWLTEEPLHKREVRKGVFRWFDFLMGMIAPALLFYLLLFVVGIVGQYGALGEGLGAVLFVQLPIVVGLEAMALLFLFFYFIKERPGISRGIATLVALFLGWIFIILVLMKMA